MVVLQHSFYLIALILAKYQASLIFSQPQDTIRSLIQGRDSVDFTNSEPADSIALPDTRSDEYPNDITFDHTHLEGDNFVPSQSTLVSASVPGAEISQEPAGNSQDSAFLPWDGNGEGVPDLIPNLPSLSLPSLPKANQIFENIMKGGIQPQEPDCDDGLFSFCCESGPPRSKIKKETPAARVLEIEAERKQRLRKCVKWNKDHPACQFPENEACCRCLSLKHFAFYCYNPHWRADPNYNGMPQPPPHPITNPKPPDDPDLDPAEPKLDPLSEKRGLGEEGDNDDDDDDSGVDIYYYASLRPSPRRRRPEELYAAKPPHPPEESWRRPASGPTRAEYMCSNEFMKSVGIAPSRPQWDLKFTPENPWPPERKPRVQKPKLTPMIRPPSPAPPDNQPGPRT